MDTLKAILASGGFILACALLSQFFVVDFTIAQTTGAYYAPRGDVSVAIGWYGADDQPLLDENCEIITGALWVENPVAEGQPFWTGFPRAAQPGGGSGGCRHVSLVAPADRVVEDPFADVVFQFDGEVDSVVAITLISSTPEIGFLEPVIDGYTYSYPHSIPFEPCTTYALSFAAEVILPTTVDPHEPDIASCNDRLRHPPVPSGWVLNDEVGHLRTPGDSLVYVWENDEGLVSENVLLPAEIAIGLTWTVNASRTTAEAVDLGPLSTPAGVFGQVLAVDYRVAEYDTTFCYPRDDAINLWLNADLVRFWFAPRAGIIQGAFLDCDSTSIWSFLPLATSPASEPAPSRGAALLSPAFPNPFNAMTTIAFEIPKREAVSLRVFDLCGRLVRNLIAGETRGPGRHEFVWNGRDDAGRQVASGTYLYRLEAGEYTETKRMVLVK